MLSVKLLDNSHLSKCFSVNRARGVFKRGQTRIQNSSLTPLGHDLFGKANGHAGIVQFESDHFVFR